MANKKLYNMVSRIMQRLGIQLKRFPSLDQRTLLKYLKDNDINHCFDIGANTGQFASLLRASGFDGTIYSFEPQKKAFELLAHATTKDSKWEAFNLGIGDEDCVSTINISKNSVSSSFLEMNQFLTNLEPDTQYVLKEDITVKKIDTFTKEKNFKKKIFLKIDAQGFESKILEGATDFFPNIYALQMEMSCISLYKGEKLFDEMKSIVERKGFYVSSLESNFIDSTTGRLLQVEGIFLRENKN